MIPALGHCQDPTCSQSSNRELVRLFRCSIHCDRLLCLFHLNAHNVYYEEEKKQNAELINELENCLVIYQALFEQHIQTYREIVQQTATLLLNNKSSIIPIEQIRSVLEKLQKSIDLFQRERIVIKTEPILDEVEFDFGKIEPNIFKEDLRQESEKDIPKKNDSNRSDQTVIVRLQRIDYLKENQPDVCSTDKQRTKSHENIRDSRDTDDNMIIDTNNVCDENSKPKARRRSSTMKKAERISKKNEKIISLKRL